MEIIETNLEFRNLEKRKLTRRVILHHAEASNCTAEDIHRWHLNRGWAGAGYHFLVRKDGTNYRLRPEECVGAHAYGSNYDSIGICAEGKYNEEEMPEVQKQAIIELVKYLQSKYNINTIQKHKDVCTTSCPGNNYPFEEIVNGEVMNKEVKQEETKTIGEVATIQNYVNEKYGFNIAVDDIYGNETKKALARALQIELNQQYNKGLVVDGIFGVKSKAGTITVRNGAKGNITYLIQAMLICHSFDIKADGIFGQDTENAIKKFQYRNSLVVDGICGKNTFYVLFR